MPAEVWHATELHPFYKPPPVWPDEYHKVADVETEDVEHAYMLTNHIDRLWTRNEGVTATPGEHRSSSVHDVVVIDGVAHRCASVGWEPIS